MRVRLTKPVAAVGAWMACVAAALGVLASYEHAPSPAGTPVEYWPLCDDEGARLVMFVHPRCPCSVASVRELGRAAARHEVDAIVYLRDGDETMTPGMGQALAESRVIVRTDRGAALARRFGVETSGHALLFDAAGRLVFSGGLTGSRGHEGWSDAHTALNRATAGERREHEVYGCGLHDACRDDGA